MKFKFKRRKAQFGTFNNRNEHHGQDARVKAVDLPVRHPITPRELDMLIPVMEGGIPTSQYLFGDDLRKPQLQTFVLFPLKVYRKPEGITFTIYDRGPKKPGLEVSDAKVKDPVVTIDLDQKMEIAYKLQFHPGSALQRISDGIEEQVCEFEIESEQEELFGPAEPEPEDEGSTPAPAQPEIPGLNPTGRPRVPEGTEDLGGPLPGEGEVDEDDDEDDDDDE